ncbi:hypothetical protein [Nocardiopsis sp. NPDC057823]|uniref:hypothetical protein n=1 Tax=Nocardiopsis sp. NPDC057823 TaxID=3346256 RepID=UPI00366C7680
MTIDRAELKKAAARYAGAKRNYGDDDKRVIELLDDFKRTRALVHWGDITPDVKALADSDVLDMIETLTNGRDSLEVFVKVVA